MRYYEILVATKSNLDRSLLYASPEQLEPCQIIRIPFLKRTLSGFVWREVDAGQVPPALRKKCRDVGSVSPHCLPAPLVTALSDLANYSSLTLSGMARLALPQAVFRRRTLTEMVPMQPKAPALTSAQRQVYRAIKQHEPGRAQMILGVNGSGKTRVYAELIKDQWQKGCSSLVLVPEIGLSAQVVALLHSYLPCPINHFHSALSAREKKDIWLRCQTQPTIVAVGPRSTEFLPIKNLGLIIVDEFHDDSFKQETQPIYDSLQMAGFLARSHGAQLVCGSATPRVSDYYRFRKARHPIHQLDKTALPRRQPQITVVDKKDSPEIFSPAALAAIKEAITNQQQALIFHNRRGHWRRAQCHQCFWQALCNRCDRPLVFHQDRFELVCHICHRKQPPLSVCPECRDAIVYESPGLKTVTDRLERHLQAANIKTPIWRFDSDSPEQENLASRLDAINRQKGLVLLGTQVVGQGLDLTNLAAIIILDAEQNLVSADYRGDENLYQRIHQLSGRVGRGHLEMARIIVQTHNPQSSTLKAALNQDWLSFYQIEIGRRRRYQLPPFTHFGTLTVRQSTPSKARALAMKTRRELAAEFKQIRFYAPLPAENERRAGGWQWLIIAESQTRQNLVELAKRLKVDGRSLNLDPRQLFKAGS